MAFPIFFPDFAISEFRQRLPTLHQHILRSRYHASEPAHLALRHNRFRPPCRCTSVNPSVRLSVMVFEDRIVPTRFAVELLGAVAANPAHSGTVTINPALTSAASGSVFVQAVAAAFVGTIAVEFGGETHTYTMGPDALEVDPSRPWAFVYSGTLLTLVDMSAPTGEWEDVSWSVSVVEAPETGTVGPGAPPPTGSGPGTSTPPPTGTLPGAPPTGSGDPGAPPAPTGNDPGMPG